MALHEPQKKEQQSVAWWHFQQSAAGHNKSLSSA